jgi:hypothetical protein
LFGLGGTAGFEWKKSSESGGRIAETLNQDTVLSHAIISLGYEEVYVVQVEDFVSISVLETLMPAQRIAEFLIPANMIAKHVRRLAW